MVVKTPGRQKLGRPEKSEEGRSPGSGQTGHKFKKKPGPSPEGSAQGKGEKKASTAKTLLPDMEAEPPLKSACHAAHEGNRVQEKKPLSQEKVTGKAQKGNRSLGEEVSPQRDLPAVVAEEAGGAP